MRKISQFLASSGEEFGYFDANPEVVGASPTLGESVEIAQ
jgi:hypothetical protein